MMLVVEEGGGEKGGRGKKKKEGEKKKKKDITGDVSIYVYTTHFGHFWQWNSRNYNNGCW
jgi:hypothetical protein